MEMPFDKEVGVIPMRDRFVAATHPMGMLRVVPTACMTDRAVLGICPAHCDRAFIDVITMMMVEMPVMQVVDVVPVRDRRMPAARTMLMRVIVVRLVVGHGCSPLDR
jgi:hypothetical protein